jgi:hypothetical protein
LRTFSPRHLRRRAGGAPWNQVPAITVVGASDDPRLSLLRDAVAFWNSMFGEIGSGFRLGPISQIAGTIPADLLTTLSGLADL